MGEAGVSARLGQVWEVVGVSNGPWLVVGAEPGSLWGFSWRLVSLSTLQEGAAVETSLLSGEAGEPSNGGQWRRLL